jgi:dUTP pyrophosphatase
MENNVLKIQYLQDYNLKKWGPMKYSKPGDACFDARAAIKKSLKIKKHSMFGKIHRYTIPLGFKVEIPFGYELQIRMRSGLAKNFGFIMSNGMGTIDAGYRGEVMALLTNLGERNVIFHPGQRIVQCKIAKVPSFKLVSVGFLSETDRGENGFGSTGL